jgi:hypothetical protein
VRAFLAGIFRCGKKALSGSLELYRKPAAPRHITLRICRFSNIDLHCPAG